MIKFKCAFCNSDLKCNRYTTSILHCYNCDKFKIYFLPDIYEVKNIYFLKLNFNEYSLIINDEYVKFLKPKEFSVRSKFELSNYKNCVSYVEKIVKLQIFK